MYLTNELLAFCVNTAISNPHDQDRFYDTVPPEEREAINQLLGAVLLEENPQEVEVSHLSDDSAQTLGSIISGGATSNKQKVVAYNFKNAAKESLLPILGVVSASTGLHVNLKQGPGTIGALIAWWRTLVILRSPQDDDAITVIRTIGVLRLRSRWERIPAAPSNNALSTETGLAPGRLHAALQKLAELGVIQAVTWGDQKDDYTHGDNRWSVSF